jgi:hypothetical protein
MLRIVIGVCIIIVSILLGFLILFGIGMADGPAPEGWDLWSQLWPAYLGILLGLFVLALKRLTS